MKDLPKGAAVLFEDETDLMLGPPLRAGWTKRGQPADVEISGQNAKRVIFGTVSLTGHRLLLIRENQRAVDFQELLKLVYKHHRHHPVLMILDGESCHTAHASERLAKELKIQLEPLPKRSPERNAIEDLWDDAKEVICANHQYPEIESQAKEFVEYLQSHTNHQAKRKAGLLRDDYWLFQ